MALTYLTRIYIRVVKILRFREILGPFSKFNLWGFFWEVSIREVKSTQNAY